MPPQLERPRPADRGDESRGVRGTRLECDAEQVQPELARLRAEDAQSVARLRRALLEARAPAGGSLLVGSADGVKADQELEGRSGLEVHAQVSVRRGRVTDGCHL